MSPRLRVTSSQGTRPRYLISLSGTFDTVATAALHQKNHSSTSLCRISHFLDHTASEPHKCHREDRHTAMTVACQ